MSGGPCRLPQRDFTRSKALGDAAVRRLRTCRSRAWRTMADFETRNRRAKDSSSASNLSGILQVIVVMGMMVIRSSCLRNTGSRGSDVAQWSGKAAPKPLREMRGYGPARTGPALRCPRSTVRSGPDDAV